MSDDDEIPDDYHTVVNDWSDIDGTRLSGPEKDLAVTVFRETDFDHIVRFQDWLLDDEEKDVLPLAQDDRVDVGGSDTLLVGSVEDYSDAAIRLYQYHRDADSPDPGAYAPKKCIVWIERGPRLPDDLETPQGRLGDFAP